MLPQESPKRTKESVCAYGITLIRFILKVATWIENNYFRALLNTLMLPFMVPTKICV
jgi:hypothetical protein